MRHPLVRVLSFLALSIAASAQSPPNVEQFDLTGIHGTSTPATTLRQQVKNHRPGDIADAVSLQRQLAAYYQAHGDRVRAKRAAERAVATQPSTGSANASTSGSGHAPSFGSVKAPSFGSVKAPSFGSVKAPSYGSVRAPSYGSVKAPSYGSVKAPSYGSVKAPGGGDVPARDTVHAYPPPSNSQSPQSGVASIPLAKPASAPGPGAMTARFYHMDGPSHMVTWDFLSDGTYLMTTIGGGAGVSARSSERGTYTISNGTLEVHVTRKTGASTTTVTGGDRSTLTGSSQQAAETRRYAVQLLGTNGKGGMVIDGVTYKVKSW